MQISVPVSGSATSVINQYEHEGFIFSHREGDFLIFNAKSPSHIAEAILKNRQINGKLIFSDGSSSNLYIRLDSNRD